MIRDVSARRTNLLIFCYCAAAICLFEGSSERSSSFPIDFSTMPYSTPLSQSLSNRVVRHPALTGALPETRCLNGKVFLTYPVASPPLSQPEKWWHFQGCEMFEETVTVWHVTLLGNLIQSSPLAPGSSGILNEFHLRNGQHGHSHQYGVFCRACPHQTGSVVLGSRLKWPDQPGCALELQAHSLKRVRDLGGSK